MASSTQALKQTRWRYSGRNTACSTSMRRDSGTGPIPRESQDIKESEIKDSFIDECLRSQTDDQKKEELALEQALMAVQDDRVGRISAEAAQRLYAVRLALNTFLQRDVQNDEEFSILIALGYELMEREGAQGIIPAIVHLKRPEGSIPPTLLHTPDFFFNDPILDYLEHNRPHSAEQKPLSLRRAITNVLTFAHEIYRWNTLYLKKHQDVGVVPTKVLIEAKGGDTRAVRRQKKLRGPEANYLIHWRAIPFRLYQELCSRHLLDYFSTTKLQEVLHSILVEQSHELLYGGYFNPALLEKVPRKGEAFQTLEVVKTHYELRQAVHPTVRQTMRAKLEKLLAEVKVSFPKETHHLQHLKSSE